MISNQYNDINTNVIQYNNTILLIQVIIYVINTYTLNDTINTYNITM